MEKQQILIPVAIGGAVFLMYLLTRKGNIATVREQPNTAGSGVPNYTPQNQQYNVNPPVLAPSPGLILMPPRSPLPSLTFGPNIFNTMLPPAPQPNPSITNNTLNLVSGPNLSRLTYNFPPLSQKDKPSPAQSNAGCGCGGGCNSCESCTTGCTTNRSRYIDGHGGCLSKSRTAQVSQATQTAKANGFALWQDYGDNIQTANTAPTSGDGGLDWFNTQQSIDYEWKRVHSYDTPAAPIYN